MPGRKYTSISSSIFSSPAVLSYFQLCKQCRWWTCCAFVSLFFCTFPLLLLLIFILHWSDTGTGTVLCFVQYILFLHPNINSVLLHVRHMWHWLMCFLHDLWPLSLWEQSLYSADFGGSTTLSPDGGGPPRPEGEVYTLSCQLMLLLLPGSHPHSAHVVVCSALIALHRNLLKE